MYLQFLFFLGILTAVASLQSAGQLNLMSQFLDAKLHNIYLIDLAIGALSSVVDNVPLVAGAMGMYPIAETGAMGYLANFTQDGFVLGISGLYCRNRWQYADYWFGSRSCCNGAGKNRLHLVSEKKYRGWHCLAIWPVQPSIL